MSPGARAPVAALDPALPPVLHGRHALQELGDEVLRLPLGPLTLRWLTLLGVALSLTLLLAASVLYLFVRGVGIWGINVPVGWGFAITNFVWWIGIGHAGTLISAILLLLRQPWRTSINRLAEAMTLFAIACAAMFPLLHLGRPARFYWLLPYPDTLGLWPQWRSALVDDVFAIATYGTVSLLFWYSGLIPDLATLRDRARGPRARRWAGVFALGWRGSARQWDRHQMLQLFLAGLATPLVVSVHSIVSLDFSSALVPGWHSTIFPPYFVAGAILSGLAMVLAIALPLRWRWGLHDLITARHLDALGKLTLVSGLVVGYGYAMEYFTAWYSGDRYELYIALERALGDYWPVFWITIFGNVLVTQALWFRQVRTRPVPLFLVACVLLVSMWTERYMIVITSLHRDYLPSAWADFHATVWDWTTLIGSLGLFGLLLWLFFRFVPAIGIYELKEMAEHHGQARPGPEVLPPPPDARGPLAGLAGAVETPVLVHEGPFLHGLVAEFADSHALREAARAARAAGFARVEAYSPFPVEGIEEALALPSTGIPRLVFLGALLGAAGGYLLCWYAAVIDYPWNVGGRPLHSWPAFLPITFELGVLGGALCGFLGFLALERLPRLHHPIFAAAGFERASVDRFFLCLEADGPSFDREAARQLLEGRGSLGVSEVPA